MNLNVCSGQINERQLAKLELYSIQMEKMGASERLSRPLPGKVTFDGDKIFFSNGTLDYQSDKFLLYE